MPGTLRVNALNVRYLQLTILFFLHAFENAIFSALCEPPPVSTMRKKVICKNIKRFLIFNIWITFESILYY